MGTCRAVRFEAPSSARNECSSLCGDMCADMCVETCVDMCMPVYGRRGHGHGVWRVGPIVPTKPVRVRAVADIVMAYTAYGLYSYGPDSYGLYSLWPT